LVIITAIPVTLRFLGLAPENGSPGLVVMIVFTSLFVAYAVTVVLIMFTSMVADTVDTQELATGLRQEALFNSVITFSSKVTSGGGLLVAGVLLDFVVGLDGSQRIDRLSSTQLVRLGVIDAYVVPLCNVVWLWLALKYTITREQHAKIRAKLDAGYAESVEEGGGSYVVEAQADRAGSAATRARGTEPD
jgi:Na+/melibiose symporter-like transporter